MTTRHITAAQVTECRKLHTKAMTHLLRGLLFSQRADYDDYKQLHAASPRPWFENNDDAFAALQELMHDIDQMPAWQRHDMLHHFFAYNLESFFMPEAKQDNLFWSLVRESYLSEVADTLKDMSQTITY